MNPTPSTNPALAFIGGGNMARSLIGGLLGKGWPAAALRVAEPDPQSRAAVADAFSIATHADNETAVEGAGAVILAVKPQVMAEVCRSLAKAIPEQALVISVAAGLTSQQIDGWLGGNRRVVRAMPNTPALFGAGATGLYANEATGPDQRALAESILAAVGCTVWIEDETQMDVVTALSGSGPAYAFLLAEAMQDAAMRLGLPAAAARSLTTHTLLGAATMLERSEEPAGTLRARVTSPGGTTQAAIESFQADGFEALVDRAIAAAARRGAELAKAAGN